jgi:glycosyltransferase involved in cell wall biosynthesis
MARILWLTKRHYLHKDLVADRYGRYYELPRVLVQRGHRVRMLLLSYGRERSRRASFEENFAWESFRRLHSARFLWRAHRLLARCEFDVVIGSSDSLYCILAAQLGRAHRVPAIADVYDDFATFASARIPGVMAAFDRSLARCAAITAFSDVLAETLATRVGRPCVVVPNGTSPRLFRPLGRAACRRLLSWPEEGRYVGYFGAITHDLGWNIVFDAIARLRATRYPSLVLKLAGPLGRGVQLPVEGVDYVGVRPHEDIAVMINASDVLLMRARHGEACFPIKLGEAVACERPVVAPAVGAMERYLRDFPEFLYAEGDAADLAAKIAALLERTSPLRFPDAPTWDDAGDAFERVVAAAA